MQPPAQLSSSSSVATTVEQHVRHGTLSPMSSPACKRGLATPTHAAARASSSSSSSSSSSVVGSGSGAFAACTPPHSSSIAHAAQSKQAQPSNEELLLAASSAAELPTLQSVAPMRYRRRMLFTQPACLHAFQGDLVGGLGDDAAAHAVLPGLPPPAATQLTRLDAASGAWDAAATAAVERADKSCTTLDRCPLTPKASADGISHMRRLRARLALAKCKADAGQEGAPFAAFATSILPAPAMVLPGRIDKTRRRAISDATELTQDRYGRCMPCSTSGSLADAVLADRAAVKMVDGKNARRCALPMKGEAHMQDGTIAIGENSHDGDSEARPHRETQAEAQRASMPSTPDSLTGDGAPDGKGPYGDGDAGKALAHALPKASVSTTKHMHGGAGCYRRLVPPSPPLVSSPADTLIAAAARPLRLQSARTRQHYYTTVRRMLVEPMHPKNAVMAAAQAATRPQTVSGVFRPPRRIDSQPDTLSYGDGAGPLHLPLRSRVLPQYASAAAPSGCAIHAAAHAMVKQQQRRKQQRACFSAHQGHALRSRLRCRQRLTTDGRQPAMSLRTCAAGRAVPVPTCTSAIRANMAPATPSRTLTRCRALAPPVTPSRCAAAKAMLLLSASKPAARHVAPANGAVAANTPHRPVAANAAAVTSMTSNWAMITADGRAVLVKQRHNSAHVPSWPSHQEVVHTAAPKRHHHASKWSSGQKICKRRCC
ncbi:hypothetical protein THASP1DRAFT_21635 [Thamnocephalis sphaerospora]|uniref:Uncharacterized protein n=1 Tax=Thamnocephalis sphaerospora TaxID=78915 RepID=A0A4P9XYA3_9FUNG|nr:hypothetical protein THASP1DRAFT_21635 [Thamnocephalis sphaerospora]|eukprot:RKP10681.1 hypothetical protein THASP1DRAFT_21635 [Thamnocephalis sphaerospora]